MKIFYRCDPKKNKMCSGPGTKKQGRGLCQNECFSTSVKEYAVRDKYGRPIIDFASDEKDDGAVVLHKPKQKREH